MSKALLIKSQIDKNGGEVGKWNNFNNAPSYIQGIHTGKMLEDISAEKLGALILVYLLHGQEQNFLSLPLLP